MKILTLSLILLVSMPSYSKYIESYDLLIFDEITDNARQLIISGVSAGKIYESLTIQGQTETKESLEHSVEGDNINCTKYLESGKVVKQLCSIAIK